MLAKVGVIIPNWNGWRATFDCLVSLRRMEYPPDQIEIIVVDNGSSDDSVAQLRACPGIVLLPQTVNLGFAAGSNVGIRQALADGCNYVLLLNNDTIVSPGFLAPLVKLLQTTTNAAAVSPKIRFENPPDRLWYAGGNFLGPRMIGEMVGLGEVDQAQYDRARVVDFAVGCCMLIDCKCFERIGYLDEDMYFYHEDVDFSLRATRAGLSVWYEPASVIVHQVSYSTRHDLPARVYYEAQSRLVFFAKHVHGAQTLIVVGLEILRLFRIMAESLWKGQPQLAQSYVRGLHAGWNRVRRHSRPRGQDV